MIAARSSPAAETTQPKGWRTPAYAGAMKSLHWVTVVLLLGTYAATWAIEGAATAAQTSWLVMVHRSLGLTLLVTTALRLAIRQRTAIPPLPEDMHSIQRVAARLSTCALYGLLFMQPLLGLVGSMLHGDRIVVFGSLVFPGFLGVNRPLARQVFMAHGWVATLLLMLIGVHVAAALHHHFIRRDHVLRSMLPIAGTPRAAGSRRTKILQ